MSAHSSKLGINNNDAWWDATLPYGFTQTLTIEPTWNQNWARRSPKKRRIKNGIKSMHIPLSCLWKCWSSSRNKEVENQKAHEHMRHLRSQRYSTLMPKLISLIFNSLGPLKALLNRLSPATQVHWNPWRKIQTVRDPPHLIISVGQHQSTCKLEEPLFFLTAMFTSDGTMHGRRKWSGFDPCWGSQRILTCKKKQGTQVEERGEKGKKGGEGSTSLWLWQRQLRQRRLHRWVGVCARFQGVPPPCTRGTQLQLSQS